uniref:LysR family transcriptional regulator n=1 Tax=Stappia sp. TaxID=1870903 RepID=UPI003BA9107F
MLLDNLALFLRIVERGGLAAGGRDLGLSPASVSERLAALERHYGVSLLVRTTRSLRLTEEGATLVDGARRLLAAAEDLDGRIRLGADRLSGVIRVTAPEDLGRQIIVPALDLFLEAHPEVTVDLDLTDGYVDLVGRGFDLAVRHGVLADSSLKARPLGENRRVVVAAPSYVERHGAPAHPDELAGHDCLLMRFGGNLDRQWSFLVDGEIRNVTVSGRRIANDGGIVRRWCREGRGIALKSIRDVAEDLAEGRLVELLGGFSAGCTALQIVYPPGMTRPRRVRMLIDHLVAELGSERAARRDLSPRALDG